MDYKQILLDRLERVTPDEMALIQKAAADSLDQEFTTQEEMEDWFTAACGGERLLGALAAWTVKVAEQRAWMLLGEAAHALLQRE